MGGIRSLPLADQYVNSLMPLPQSIYSAVALAFDEQTPCRTVLHNLGTEGCQEGVRESQAHAAQLI